MVTAVKWINAVSVNRELRRLTTRSNNTPSPARHATTMAVLKFLPSNPLGSSPPDVWSYDY